MSGLMRLQKFLSSGGIASRRAAEKLISEGRIKVNEKVVTEPGTKVDPLSDKVEVDNLPVTILKKKKYFLLNKPSGYLTTVKDPYKRPTVMDLIPKKFQEGLFPVGRLDLDTEGLLLMTNDGEMAFRLTHPRYEIEKEYLAQVKGTPSKDDLYLLRTGVVLEEGKTAPAKVEILSSGDKMSLLRIIIHEGKKRQIKRICAAVGHPVVFLKRNSYAFLNLGNLKPGLYRSLTEEEVQKLYRLLKLP
ncbi:MAG: pseudouridine synthase [Bacillota bacterium]|nr:pseudouridine synthase [Bacillota bacterium]